MGLETDEVVINAVNNLEFRKENINHDLLPEDLGHLNLHLHPLLYLRYLYFLQPIRG